MNGNGATTPESVPAATHNLDPIVVQKIEDEHEAAVKAGRSFLRHAAECGRLLLKQQRQVQEAGGNWGEWVKAHLSFGERQARKYMQFAKAVSVKPDLVNSVCTLDGVLKLISDPEAPPAPTPTAKANGKATAKAEDTKPARSNTPDPGKWISTGVGIAPKQLRGHVAKLRGHERKNCIGGLKVIRDVLNQVINEEEATHV